MKEEKVSVRIDQAVIVRSDGSFPRGRLKGDKDTLSDNVVLCLWNPANQTRYAETKKGKGKKKIKWWEWEGGKKLKRKKKWRQEGKRKTKVRQYNKKKEADNCLCTYICMCVCYVCMCARVCLIPALSKYFKMNITRLTELPLNSKENCYLLVLCLSLLSRWDMGF